MTTPLTSQQFKNLQKTSLSFRSETAADRLTKLNKIKNWLQTNETEVLKALHADFSKPEFETNLTEIIPVYSEINFFLKNLKIWMKDKKVPTPASLLGHSSAIRFENKGVVLIISPWNYPFYLAIVPLITAIAAGNTVVIKPSELTPHTSNVILKLAKDCFTEDQVLVSLGDKTTTEHLLTFNFNHVFFTGSTAVGRIIAKACAEKLIPTTLELGGKSPTVIDETADIQLAANKIFWGKFLNRGQTCVAPDYILIHESVYEIFNQNLNVLIQSNTSNLEGQIINDDHDARLSKLAEKPEGFFKANPLKVKLIKDLSDPTMKDEIFGPVLPILKYKNAEEIDQVLNHYEKPLSLYIFSKNKNFIERLLVKHTSGGVAINTVIMHLANPHLPFGGVGASGMGRYHGHYGFLELSHQRAIIKLRFFKGLSSFITPPYTSVKANVLKWFKN